MALDYTLWGFSHTSYQSRIVSFLNWVFSARNFRSSVLSPPRDLFLVFLNLPILYLILGILELCKTNTILAQPAMLHLVND